MVPKRMNNLAATRRTLLSRLRSWEDQDSWQEFFDIYWRLIYSFACQSGLTSTEAEEAVQETLVAVAKKMPGFHYNPEIGSFKAWLLHTTQWKVRDQLRKRQRVNRVLERALEENSTPSSGAPVTENPNPQWDAEWATHLLEAAVARVKENVSAQQFQVFQLCALDGWAAKDVARQLGLNRGQVYVAKCRVQRLVKQELRHLETHVI